jgi:hypothetical protein
MRLEKNYEENKNRGHLIAETTLQHSHLLFYIKFLIVKNQSIANKNISKQSKFY